MDGSQQSAEAPSEMSVAATADGGLGGGDDLDGSPPALPAVRIAPMHELATAARNAPLLRQARRLARWVLAGTDERPLTGSGRLRPGDAAAAIAELEIGSVQPQPRSAGDVPELEMLWRVSTGAGLLTATGRRARPGPAMHALDDKGSHPVLEAWESALDAVLGSGPEVAREELEGMATALYAAGEPVPMDSLFEAFTAAVSDRWPGARERDPRLRMSQTLEILADLGVADLGVDEEADQLTVALTALGAWGIRRRLVAAGFSAPVKGAASGATAPGLLAALAAHDAEDGEQEIAAWLRQRSPQRAAAELIRAARQASPGGRGAAFAILDRLGDQAIPLVRTAMEDPLLRPHAAIWLREHGVAAELGPDEQAWLLVDLGAGLLEEADASAVSADLLPDLPAAQQAELVSGLWQVTHPAVIGLLTTLSDHHPEPSVAKAARKAAFKARSHLLGFG
jgi:hypothetical protein